MSRTGNLLFPEDDGGGWVTTIIKALPKDELPPPPNLTPEQMRIDDPVGIAADSAFSNLAAETANRDAIYAAGWSADVKTPPPVPPPAPAEIQALDAAIAHEAGNAFFGAVVDPVGASADAAFAETAAEVATRQAIEAAGWSAGSLRSTGAAPAATAETPLTPEALNALDSVIDRQAAAPDFDVVVDPVASQADARFAEAAAEQATRDAIAGAGWSANTVEPWPTVETAPPPSDDTRALDALAAGLRPDAFAAIDDPVAAQADARFSERAAEQATRDAIADAGWSAETAGPPVRAAAPPVDDTRDLDAAVAAQSDDAFAPIADPLGDEASARFAEAAADAATREALAEAGWSAEAMGPAARTAETFLPEDIRDLDAVVAGQSADAFAPIADPLGDEAAARFAEAAADLATREALADAGWWAKPETGDDQRQAAELQRLDALADKAALADARFAEVADPVGLAADATFAETAARVAETEAVRAARAAAEDAARAAETAAAEAARAAAAPAPGQPLTPAELKTLDEIASRVGDIAARVAAEDPVAIEAEAAFAERAAELAIADAVFAAGWHPRAVSADTLVADVARRGRRLESAEIEDLVRAEAEIAFEDAAYDIASRNVGTLVTGEAAALAAFDQAIAAGMQPEEALQLAIAAAEELDPRAFGGLARVATLPVTAEDLPLLPPRAASAAAEAEAARPTQESPPPAPPAPLDATAPPAFTVAAVGQGFIAVTGTALLFGAAGADTLAPPSFRFVFDPSVISAPGSGFRPVERDDDDLVFVPPARQALSGSTGDDFLVGSNGNDGIGGLEGDDYIYGDRPTNYLPGTHDALNPLTDPVFGSGGDDVISGGAGSDSIWGGPGNDIIDGDVTAAAGLSGLLPFPLGGTAVGNDFIDGGAGNDTIHGGGGNDVLYGGSGNDNIFGYAGDDVIVGGQGVDVVSGGAGADQFRFEGGSGATSLQHAQSLGTDVIEDFSAAESDSFALSDADFSLGAAGTLTDGTNYFEHATVTLNGTPLDASGGAAGPAVVVFGSGAGTDGVSVYYTDDASAMTDANSYQIADVKNANLTEIAAGDFNLRA